MAVLYKSISRIFWPLVERSDEFGNCMHTATHYIVPVHLQRLGSHQKVAAI